MYSTINEQTYRNNKVARPFSSEQALHVTMRTKLSGVFAVRRTRSWLCQYVPQLAFKKGIRLYHLSINSNHLHIVLKAPSQIALSFFLRVLAGVSARKVLGAERGRPGMVAVWHERPYSRVLHWGREFCNVMRYVQRNALETMGLIRYQKRGEKLSDATREFIAASTSRTRERRAAWLGMQLSLF